MHHPQEREKAGKEATQKTEKKNAKLKQKTIGFANCGKNEKMSDSPLVGEGLPIRQGAKNL